MTTDENDVGRRGLKLAFALAWAAIAVAMVGLVLLLGWRPFRSGVDLIPYRERAVTAEEALSQILAGGQAKLGLAVAEVPATVRAGEELVFVVVVRNPTRDSISLEPCPALFASFGESGTVAFAIGRLNCRDAPRAVKPMEDLRFEWRIEIPARPNFHDGFAGTIYVAIGSSEGRTSASSRIVTVRS